MPRLIALLLFLPILGFAANNVDDYAYAYKLKIKGDNPIYSFDLPQKIYESLTDNDYADIRVFNADNIAVPYLLERTSSQIEQTPTTQNISFFPMFLNSKNKIEAASINIDTRQDGTVINVTQNNQETQSNNSLLLDLSQFEVKPTVFTLQFSDNHPDFNQVVTVNGSDDLATWMNINSNISLTNLHFAEHRLIKNNIKLPLNNWKYLRISWAGKLDLKLDSIQGREATQYLDLPRKKIKLSENNYDHETKSFFYYNKGRFPIDRLSINLKPRNSLLNITVASSDSIDGPWRIRHKGIAYNLKQNGKIILSDGIKITQTNDSYWRITAITDRDNIASLSPSLELAWLAHKLTFIAEGSPPFMIAFGNSAAEKNSTANSVAKLIKQQNNREVLQAELELTPRITLGGKTKLQVEALDNINVKTIILWSVLILGLAILTMMAMQLYKQISKPS